VTSRRRWIAAAAALAALAGAVTAVSLAVDHTSAEPPCTVTESPHAPVADPSASGGHLQFQLLATGAIRPIQIAGRALPTRPVSSDGFSIRTVGGNPNLLPDPGFELDSNGDGTPDGWELQGGATTPKVDQATAHSGGRSFVISNPTAETSGAFAAKIGVVPGTYYVLSGWFKSEAVQPTVATVVREPTNRHSSVQLQVTQFGSNGPGTTSIAYGYTDTAGWNKGFAGFQAGDDVHQVEVRGLLDDGSGTAWFDDLYLGRLLAGAATSAAGPVSTDGDGRLRQHADLTGEGVTLDATYAVGTDNVRIDGTVASTTGQDRALQVAYSLPIDARGWQWEDYARRSRTIGSVPTSYATVSSLQSSSRYPFGVISDDRSALAIGVPLDQPRMFRIQYDPALGLSIVFDLGLSPAATRLGGEATFSFVIYTVNPAWGFRAATQRYYDLFPDLFVHRTDPACEGTWFVAPPLDTVTSRAGDFGLGFNMVALGKSSHENHVNWGTKYLPADNDRRIYTSAYTHEWAFFDVIGPHAKLPPYDRAVAHVEAEARSTPKTDEERLVRTEAMAALESTARDFNGRFAYERYGRFLAYYQNLEPIPSAPIDWVRAVQKEQVERALSLASGAGATLNGIHLDSTSGMRRWGAVDDYDRAHWAEAGVPLTFSYDSGLVVERGIFAMYDRMRQIADFVHRRGMILSVNFNADETRSEGYVGADQFDYFGLEQGLAARIYGQTPDQFAMLKRTLAFQRPLSTLDQAVGAGTLSLGQVDARLQQNLFYGIFSGAWNPKVEADGMATGDKGWWDDAHAALWARYAPVFRELQAAGWEPMTDARSSNPGVWVERVGSLAARDLHLTIRNETETPQQYVLTVDLSVLGDAEAVRALTATEEVEHIPARVTIAAGGTMATIAAWIPPKSTRVFAFRASP